MENKNQLSLWLGDNQPQSGLASLIRTSETEKDKKVVAISASMPKKKAMGVLLNLTGDELDKAYSEKNREFMSLVVSRFTAAATTGSMGGASIKISKNGRVSASLIPVDVVLGKKKAGKITTADAIKALREAGMTDDQILTELTKPVEKDVPGDATIKQPEGSKDMTPPLPGTEAKPENKAPETNGQEPKPEANADFAGPEDTKPELTDENKADVADDPDADAADKLAEEIANGQ